MRNIPKPKSLKSLEKKAQAIVNKYIRLKYAFASSDGLMARCYTCGKIWLLETTQDKKEYQCGHYFREDLYASVRYDHNNLRPQCAWCNKRLSGNLSIYAEKLLDEIGIDEWNMLCFRKNQVKKYSAMELEQIIFEHEELLLQPELARKLILLN